MIAGLPPLRERYEAVLLDLDGTLLDGVSALTARARRAVEALTEAGLEVILCTGRSFTGALPVYAELGLDTVLVAYNGGWIGHPGQPPWRRHPIPDRLVPAIERVETQALFSFRHNGGRKHSIRRAHSHYDRVATWYSDVVLHEDARRLPQRDLMRVSCYFDASVASDRAWRQVGETQRRELLVDTYAMSTFPEFRDSTLVLLDIQPRSRGKAEAFDYLRAERGLSPERVVAVGDQRNDIPMLREAGLAVAMGNANADVRGEADLVIGRHDEEGFAEWVEGIAQSWEPPCNEP